MKRSALAAGFLFSAALIAAGCQPCDERAGTLCRIAGTGKTGFNGDGHAPLDTDFYQVTASRVGPDGLLYVMDFNNHRLRRVSTAQKVETVAGTGEHAFSQPGQPATSSPLENPVDFAFAPDGTLHLVMLHDPRVVAVREGKLEVVAGTDQQGDSGDEGPALQARFTQLAAIAFAADGSMFLCDELSHRVRVVRPDGTVHAVAGTGAPGFSGDGGHATQAALDSPRGLAVDGEGALLIADAGNHRIRRVAADGTISTVAGTGQAGFFGDGGAAANAQLKRPEGVTAASDGSLYIADTENQRVRRVGPDGVITTVAGTGERGSDGDGAATERKLSNPYGVSMDGADLLIAELRSGKVSRVYAPGR